MGEFRGLLGWNFWTRDRAEWFCHWHKSHRQLVIGFYRYRAIFVANPPVFTYVRRGVFRRRWLWAGIGPVRSGNAADQVCGISIFVGPHCWNFHTEGSIEIDPGGYMSQTEKEAAGE